AKTETGKHDFYHRRGRQMKPTYEQLEQQLAESQREFRAADATIENLQMQVEKLAAENAGLKSACERVSMWNDFPHVTLRSTGEVVPYAVAYGSNGERDYMCNIAASAVLKDTPATAAFLAEVRARGVEMLARETEKLGWHESTVRFVLKFAAQIRKGAQS